MVVDSDPDINDLISRQALQPLGYQVTVVTDAVCGPSTGDLDSP